MATHYRMFSAEFSGVKDAYNRLGRMLNTLGEIESSRNGPVKTLPGPIMVMFNDPRKRVLFDAARDANPFFHLMEALWMLAGRNDTAFVQQFNSNITSYSDDGTSFNAAYGYRWSRHFGYDQLDEAVAMLKANPDDRRVVVGMWDPNNDLGSSSKDIPCNTQIMFRIVKGVLNMLTTNRSNDLIWGLCGANYVHMSIMHEWVSAAVGVPLGTWHHVSNNLHVYERHWKLIQGIPAEAAVQYYQYDRYDTIDNADLFRKECHALVDGQEDDFDDPFLYGTAAPMLAAWRAHKAGDKKEAMYQASCIEAWDWRVACIEWLQRRNK